MKINWLEKYPKKKGYFIENHTHISTFFNDFLCFPVSFSTSIVLQRKCASLIFSFSSSTNMFNHTKIKYSYVFNRKNELNNTGKALIQIRAYQSGITRYFSTGIYVEPKYWSDSKKQIKTSLPNHSLLNKRLWNLHNQIETYELKVAQLNGFLSIRKLHEFRSLNNAANDNFVKFCQNHLDKSDMKPSSRKTFQNTINKLSAYSKNATYQEINYSFVLEFDRFLRKQGLHPNTVERQHNRLKTFILEAIRQDKIKVDDNPYKKFRKHLAKKIEPKRIFVTGEEIKRIESLAFTTENKSLEKVRDAFLMQFYTGLRHSDIKRITANHISCSKEKGYILTLIAQKTTKRIEYPLSKLFREQGDSKSRPEKIIDRYLEKIGDDKDKPLFYMSNQPYNRALKRIARLARIEKDISSHAARRGFAVYLSTRVEAPVLQRLMQHSSLDMTDDYIQLSNQDIEKQLSKILWS